MDITSPTGSSSTLPEGSTPPASEAPFEIYGLKLRLPRLATYAIAIIATLSTAIPLFSQVLLPMIQQYTATSRADKAKADAEKAKADEEAARSREQKDKLDQELTRFKEYQNHFNESPRSTQKLFDNPDLGSLSVSFYTSDGCLLVKRKAPGQRQAEMSYWVAAKSIPLEAPPGTKDDARQSRLEAPPQNSQPLLNASYQFASFNPGGAPLATERGGFGCGDSHPGQFQTWNGDRNGCWVQVWRRWPDGCQHYQWFNSCNGYWDNQPNGAPKVSWTNCVH